MLFRSSGASSTPGVTFQNMPSPDRSGTPDEGAAPGAGSDGKRRRTLSTQGVQRLARRISISGKRQGSSSSIPAAILNTFKRDSNSSVARESSKDSKDGGKDKAVAKDDSKDNLAVRDDGSLAAAEGSVKDSPSASVNSEGAQDKKKKKESKKKEKKRKSMGPA